ncbi:hypothetical protein HGI47_05495 [Novosphingobium sp. ERN07]|uniref:hypothetical protein n=1 Tax=Novosphingobium sp. ERN07 TaxID=2726187 RepID=UPI0014569934|nr:hypothetical protein [Novosphingobium sp. ERN07]NLR70324.1 hypothetical protein [Novosphingobium sp. ERN07]
MKKLKRSGARIPLWRVLCLLCAVLLGEIFAKEPVKADSWALPSVSTYTSPDGHTRVIVTPRDLDDQLAYFRDKAEGIEPAGQRESGSRAASAKLERKISGRWVEIWNAELANEIAPVEGIVRNDGAYFVTFDDWHGTGYGPNATVIYGAKGERVAQISLSTIVPKDYIEALPHSVSSIRWRGEGRFSKDGNFAVIPVIIPSADQSATAVQTVDFAVRLTDGTVSPIDPRAWKRAVEVASSARADQLAEARAAKDAFLAPLVGPSANTERAWHNYLREAVARIYGDGDTPSTTVLRSPKQLDYAISEDWVREVLTEPLGNQVALATLSEPNLVKVLAKIVPTLANNSLSRTTVFVAVTDDYWPDVVSVMRPTGANLVQLDPKTPLKQREERIRRRYGSEAASLGQLEQSVFRSAKSWTSIAVFVGICCGLLWSVRRRVRPPS